MSVVASLLSAIMLGSFEAFIPGFNPISYLYEFLFSESLPEYLYVGFSAIGYFSLLYSFVSLILSPITCNAKVSIDFSFEKPSKEDFIYVPLLYLVYLYVVHVKGLLTPDSAAVGLLAIMLPMIYRFIVYFVNTRLSTYSQRCDYNLIVFVVSITLAVPVTALYLFAMHYVATVI